VTCPFCHRVEGGEVTEQNDLAAAFPDGYPVSEGHTLIVPKRHEGDFFRLTPDEQESILELARLVQKRLSKDDTVDGFNIGINVGEAAGQTVGHAHMHVIPRRAGDVENPRGGVRHVIPSKGDYQVDS
jgi:diadenosine tetraphosphate (Ap4A) HIT family hydrolase